MKTTFISFIGTGRKVDGSKCYQLTNYLFHDGRTIPASVFAEAVRESRFRPFDEVLFIGTETSSWGTLLNENAPEDEALFLKLWEAAENGGLKANSPLAEELAQALSQRWNKPVRLEIHSAVLDCDTDAVISGHYLRQLFESGDNLLIDVTHSFRWMPIFLLSALQQLEATGRELSLEIIYGEFNEDSKISNVRSLNAVSTNRRIARSVELFFNKFEAAPLAAELKPLWPEGAKAIQEFGDSLLGNYIIPLVYDRNDGTSGQTMKMLKNAFAKFPEETAPAWLQNVHLQLRQLYAQINQPEVWQRVRAISMLFADRKLYAQAVLTLNLCAELVILKASGTQNIPEYDSLRQIKKDFFDDHGKLWKKGKFIDYLRNMLAHGALNSSDQSMKENRNQATPKITNLASDYRKAEAYLKELIAQTHV